MLRNQFVKPAYNSHCFADLPGAISSLLGGTAENCLSPEIFDGRPPRYDAVVLVLADALGWNLLQEHQQRRPLLQRVTAEGGDCIQLTSQFPSTTAAHMTCIHTGLPVSQSGIHEWQYYEPSVDALIAPLLYSFAGTMERDTLAGHADPSVVYPTRTLYQGLKEQGIASHVFQYRSYTPSTFSDAVFSGAQVHPYITLPQALAGLQRTMQEEERPSYYFLYFAGIDSVSHAFGPHSAEAAAEVDAFLLMLDRLLLDHLPPRTLLMVTADHGQTTVDPRRTIYLNQDPRFARIERFLKRSQRGDFLIPAGSPRDLFLYIHPEELDEARTWLQERLDGVATVIPTTELVEEGYFGSDDPAAAFWSRVGNLVILPAAGETVWWYDEGHFEMKFYGHHGGLSPDEMEIPLILYSR